MLNYLKEILEGEPLTIVDAKKETIKVKSEDGHDVYILTKPELEEVIHIMEMAVKIANETLLVGEIGE